MNIVLKIDEGADVFLDNLQHRLTLLGHNVCIHKGRSCTSKNILLRFILASERKLLRLPQPTVPEGKSSNFDADLIVDLTQESVNTQAPRLTVEINGHADFLAALASTKTKSRHANIVVFVDGRAVAQGQPMMSRQVFLSHTRDELNAAVETLVLSAVARLSAGQSHEISCSADKVTPSFFLLRYPYDFGRAVLRKVIARLSKNHKPFYWQTAWRVTEGNGISPARDRPDPTPFIELKDDGERFYADPFPFEYKGRFYVFVEEFPYREDKGVISVAELQDNGTLSQPRIVLREPHHLSYPNVFRHKDSIFMIPESGGAQKVVLYRAEEFPDRWIRERVLIEGANINDVTLIERDGRFYMFATEKIGKGSASDTLVVYSAPDLMGPWLPHKLNPILVDKRGARPGGCILEENGRLFLPVQDGSEVYGGGLGLREILSLNDEDVILGNVFPVTTGSAWQKKGIHTLNRCGPLEVVDSTW
ncbi:hypothetical protein [Rhizobium sp. FKY42]|uniref:glucosamine inositolphosphorylceramide transferase family protein n=1 Tax=Rhizobium sp. FKY42 TaxID=2562310 RepID=UPI0010BF77A8|nr:hypothetical protein [Rhizobium sp. FKY42]